MQTQQSIEVRGTRIEYTVWCEWCCGHGYEPTEYGTVESCDECHGSGFKFRHVMEDDNE